MNDKASPKNILITGAARRLGAEIARHLHQQGRNVIVHYQHSQTDAEQLCQELNNKRTDSALAISADLTNHQDIATLAKSATSIWGGLDGLVNNASNFYMTSIADVNQQQWDDLLGCNLQAPFFLAQALVPTLRQRQGCIVNLIDIHAERGLLNYSVYCIAKAGLAAMTRVLAKELSPDIRVNGVSPGAILWPEHDTSNAYQQEIIAKTLLQRCGNPNDIASAVNYLINDADYVTGQIITVDGGRTLSS